MKKVAHFIDSNDPGGAETLVIEMCRHLDSYGYQSEVWHFGNQWLEEKCQEHRIPALLVPGHRFYKSIKTIPIFSFIFAGFIRRQKIDILHSHLFGAITGAALSAFLTRTPHVGTIHDTYTLAERRLRAYLLWGAAIFGTKLVVVSMQMKDYIEGLCKFPQGAIGVISNGVNLNAFSGSRTMSIRAELGFGAEDIILISVGRLVEIKGYDILIKAFSLLNSGQRPVRLLIVGDGPERGKYETMISKMGIEERVMLLGQRNDVPELLKSSDCFVLSSRSEGLSCSIIEAMAAGLPIVATDVGGNAELIKDGISGYLVPPDDPVSLANGLRELISNDNKRRQFGKGGFEIACSNFSIDSMMKQYVSLYNSLLI